MSPIWPRSASTYFLYHRLPKRRALCLQAYCLLTTNPLSRNIHHLMFFFSQVGAMPATRCRTADGAVRRLAPIPPPCGEDGGRLYSCGGIRKGGKRGARGRRGPRTLSLPLFYSQDKPCSGCVVCALWSPTHGCGWAGETKVRSARHQGSWRQKGGKKEASMQPVA